MPNPIVQMLNASKNRQNPTNNVLQTLNVVKSMMTGKNPEAVLDTLINNNKKFAQFVNDNKGKSVEQIASDYGIDLNMIKNLL